MSQPTDNVHTCKSCQNKFTGIYCNVCGEKILTAKDKSLKTILNSVMLTLTFTDSRFVKALWLIIKDPGSLSKDFSSGMRVKNISPMSVFFVLNLIYFFFPVIQLFSASLNTQLLSPLNKVYANLIAHKSVALGLDLQSFTFLYNTKTTALAKLLVMVFVVIASLPLNFLYWKRNKFFTDHVTYSVELACFNLFINAILLTLIVRLFGLGSYINETTLTIIFISTNLYFVVRSGMKFYHEKSWRLLIKSVFLILFLKVALEAYRSVLFFITLLML